VASTWARLRILSPGCKRTFSSPNVNLEDGVRALLHAAESVGATARELRTSTDFRRYELTRGSERCKVDLVIDRAPQIAEKVSFGVVRADTTREIAANKLCALFDRQEPRDLFDLRLLVAEGIKLSDALDDAMKKHAGVTAASLAWALSAFRLAPTAPVPRGSTTAELDQFRSELIEALTRLALPAD